MAPADCRDGDLDAARRPRADRHRLHLVWWRISLKPVFSSSAHVFLLCETASCQPVDRNQRRSSSYPPSVITPRWCSYNSSTGDGSPQMMRNLWMAPCSPTSSSPFRNSSSTRWLPEGLMAVNCPSPRSWSGRPRLWMTLSVGIGRRPSLSTCSWTRRSPGP